MGKKGRDRSQRRSRFDDDAFSGPDTSSYERPRQTFQRPQRADAAPGGPPIDAIVKWFNQEKGFGFVELTDGSGDVFLHAAVLEAAGHSGVDPGAKLSVQVGVGQKGRQVSAVLAVDASTAVAPRAGPRPGGPRTSSGGGRDRPDPSTATELVGAVKWFNTGKGFGFVGADDGGKDVFIHATVLEKAGIRELAEGQRVTMRVVTTPKGREALSVALAE